jgi:Tol biopolymer transport system component
MGPSGESPNIIARYGVDGGWHPDGEHVTYVNWDTTRAYRERKQIYRARADGTGEVRLTDLPDTEFLRQPAVSPDGTQIAFVNEGADGTSELFLMPAGLGADGAPHGPGDVRQVTEDRGLIYTPRWHPEGGQIVFERFIPNESQRLYFLDTETLAVRPVFPARSE